MQIPVIDISAQNQEAAQQLLNAVATYGFAFVDNDPITGISQETIDQMFDISKRFFALPTSVKEEVSISSNKAGKNHGWLSRGVEKLDPVTQKRPDVKEAFNLGLPTTYALDSSDASPAYEQPIPTSFQPTISSITSFQMSCHALCQHILQLLAQALDIPSDWFASRHDFVTTGKPCGAILRLLYYPYVPQEDLGADGEDIRAGAHSDYGSVTLLFQQRGGAPGLEILDPVGNWSGVPVDPRGSAIHERNGHDDLNQLKPLPILVNVGDLLEDWTGGLLKSTIHRVIFPAESSRKEDRYSMAYFCHPLDDALLEAVPSKKVEEVAKRAGRKLEGDDGKMRTAKDHLMDRLAATYSIPR